MMNLRAATMVAQKQLQVGFPTLVVDGKWGNRTDSAYVGSPPGVQSEVSNRLAINGHDIANVRKVAKTGLTSVESAFVVQAQARGVTGSSLANLLANVKVESGFSLNEESHRYTVSRARETFPTSLKRVSDSAIIDAVAKGKSSFFELVYGHSTARGKDLGNVKPGDGGKYFGRGYIQLTGLYNYTQFAKWSGLDVVSDPDLLSRDHAAAIAAAVWYWAQFVMKKNLQRDIKKSSLAVNPAGVGMSERIAAASSYRRLVA